MPGMPPTVYRLPLGAARRRRAPGRLPWALAWLVLLPLALTAHAQELPEYRLKAAFLYNFALYTEWPADLGRTLTLCIHGPDPFGRDIDVLQGKPVGGRSITVLRKAGGESLAGCQIVFIAPGAIASLPRVLEAVRGRPVLTVADSSGSARLGVALNMAVAANRITFEANLAAARGAGLNLSSKLLHLATEVIQ
jgi:hypothetical protein